MTTSERPSSPSLSYRDAGVDIDAGDALVERIKPFARRTLRPEVIADIGGFGALIEIGKRFREPVLVAGTDGVGTKLKLAFALDRHDTVGIDLVAMSVNDILVQGAEPLFFLDYFACGKLDVDVAADVIKGIAAGCEQAGCALIGGETAEMPGMYAAGEYDLAGFAVGVVEKSRAIDGRSIAAGDVLLGLASSGLHSNGFSLIRRIVDAAGADLAAPFDAASGARTLGETLLEPTRIYVKPLLGRCRRAAGQGHGAHHRRRPASRTRTGCSRTTSPRASTASAGRSRRCSPGCSGTATSPTTKCTACSTAASAWSSSSVPNTRRRGAAPARRRGRDGVPHRRGRAARDRRAGHRGRLTSARRDARARGASPS